MICEVCKEQRDPPYQALAVARRLGTDTAMCLDCLTADIEYENTRSKRYALHIGLENLGNDELDSTRESLQEHVNAAFDCPWWNKPINVEVLFDGDSFIEWGENGDTADFLHGVILFSLDGAGPGAAWAVATTLVSDLVCHPDRVVSLLANCSPFSGAHEPFALTDAADWSMVVPKDA